MRGASRGLAVDLAEADRGADLIALAAALLIIRGDPLASARLHVLQAEQTRQWFRQDRVAPDAQVGPATLLDLVQLPALPAQLRSRHRQRVLLTRLRSGQDHLVNLVLRPLVVDDAPRPELSDREEARALHELIARIPPRAAPRDIGGQGKPGEVVARQEPLAGEVAVDVEVRLRHPVAACAQQLQLRLSLAPDPSCRLLVLVRAARVLDDRGL